MLIISHGDYNVNIKCNVSKVSMNQSFHLAFVSLYSILWDMVLATLIWYIYTKYVVSMIGYTYVSRLQICLQTSVSFKEKQHENYVWQVFILMQLVRWGGVGWGGGNYRQWSLQQCSVIICTCCNMSPVNLLCPDHVFFPMRNYTETYLVSCHTTAEVMLQYHLKIYINDMT